MKRKMIRSGFKILIVLLIAFTAKMQAQNAEAFTKLDTNAIMIGDQIGMDLGISLPLGFVAVWPTIADTLSENIEVISVGKIDTVLEEQQMKLSRRLTITSFDSGYFEVPGMEFGFGKQGDTLLYSSRTASMFLQVYTPEVDTSQAFKAIRGPIAEPYTFMEIFPWVLGGLLVIFIIALAIWFFVRWKKKKPVFAAKPKPLRPAHEVALEKLEELRLAKVWQSGKLKEYHSQLTDVVREYADRRFGFDAIEMTTDEIMQELKQHAVNEGALEKIRLAFELSDLVKFAKAQPTALENDLSLSHCVDFVKETTQVAKPQEEENVEEVTKEEGGDHV